MAIKKTQRGFALLVSVIFMSVVLALGLALSSLSYKQEMLALSAIESQYAFYAADAALECALYADQQQSLFDYSSHDENNPPNAIVCDNLQGTVLPGGYNYNSTLLSVTERLSLDSGTRCADVTVYKYKDPQSQYANMSTFLFSQGYDVSCVTVGDSRGARFVSRGESIAY